MRRNQARCAIASYSSTGCDLLEMKPKFYRPANDWSGQLGGLFQMNGRGGGGNLYFSIQKKLWGFLGTCFLFVETPSYLFFSVFFASFSSTLCVRLIFLSPSVVFIVSVMLRSTGEKKRWHTGERTVVVAGFHDDRKKRVKKEESVTL